MKVNGRTLTDDEIDSRLGRQYRTLETHYKNGLCDDHPADSAPRSWPGQLRAIKENGTAASDCGDPETKQGLDTPEHTEGTPEAPSANDSALERPVSMTEGFKGLDRFSPNPSKSHEPLTAFRK